MPVPNPKRPRTTRGRLQWRHPSDQEVQSPARDKWICRTPTDDPATAEDIKAYNIAAHEEHQRRNDLFFIDLGLVRETELAQEAASRKKKYEPPTKPEHLKERNEYLVQLGKEKHRQIWQQKESEKKGLKPQGRHQMQHPDKDLGKGKTNIAQWQVERAEWTLKQRDEATASRSKDDDPHQHPSSGSGLAEERRLVVHRSCHKDIGESGGITAGFEWLPWMKEEFKHGEHMKARNKRLCCRAGCN